MRKISANISDQAFEELRHIQYILNIEYKHIITANISMSETLDEIIGRAHRSLVAWYESNKSDSSLNNSLTNT